MARVLRLFLGGLVSLVFVSGIILSSFSVSADEQVKVSNVDISVPASCELSGTGTNSHTADINNGTYMENIGKTTLTVFCNDGGGYAIYAVGYTGEEIGGTNSTKLVGEDYSLTIDTGVYAQGTTTSSVWAMKLTKVTNTSTSYLPANLTIENGFDSYHVVPAAYTKVASFTSTTDLTLGSKLETTYAAYISGTQRADIYNGKVKYTLVHPSSEVPPEPKTCASNTICYWPNSSATDSMGDQSITSSATSATLWASNFQRPGYGFAGWSDAYDYVANVGSASNPNAHIYGPNETIEFTAGQYSATNGGLSLYAVWVPSVGYLQDWTGCSILTQGNVTALTDARDNDTYAVAKLADGKCWMIENLRLDYTATGNTDGSLAQGYGGAFAGLAEPETANFANNTTANSLYKSDGSGDIAGGNGTTLSDIGTANTPGYRMPRYRNDDTNTNSTINPNTNVANMTDTAQNIYGYGNYYSWSAALANTNYYSSPTATDGNGKTSETANTSICPSGWRLPYGRNTGNGDTPGGFYYLNYKLNNDSDVRNIVANNKLRSYPNNFVCSGYVISSSVNARGSGGYYWSSTTYNSIFAYSFIFGSSDVYPGTDVPDKYHGRIVRCVISN